MWFLVHGGHKAVVVNGDGDIHEVNLGGTVFDFPGEDTEVIQFAFELFESMVVKSSEGGPNRKGIIDIPTIEF